MWDPDTTYTLPRINHVYGLKFVMFMDYNDLANTPISFKVRVWSTL